MKLACLNLQMATVMTTSWHAKIADWSKLDEQEAIKAIRQAVYIIEQSVPEELEWDDYDSTSQHLLVSGKREENIATARMYIEKGAAHIGRMAVLKPYRQQGIGSLMLVTLLEQAAINNVKEIKLNAQTAAIGFYQRYGFATIGNEFQDAGIPHYKMLFHEKWKLTHMTNDIHQRIENSHIGDNVKLKLNNAEDNRLASISIAQQARHSIDIISRDLDQKIYDNEAFKDAMKNLATGSTKAKIRILIHDCDTVVKKGHRLVELARRLTSFIDIRVQGKRFNEFNEAWLIVDSKAWIRRPLSDKYDADVDYSAARKLKETHETFNAMWNEASQDPNLRRLSL